MPLGRRSRASPLTRAGSEKSRAARLGVTGSLPHHLKPERRARAVRGELRCRATEHTPAVLPPTVAWLQRVRSDCRNASDSLSGVRKGPVGRRNGIRASGLVYSRETKMPKSNRKPNPAETGEQVPARPHDSGSAANETVDGLDATTEALRHAAEDTPSGTGPGDIEKTPVFDRAGQAPKI
jgi:hypothetical protein